MKKTETMTVVEGLLKDAIVGFDMVLKLKADASNEAVEAADRAFADLKARGQMDPSNPALLDLAIRQDEINAEAYTLSVAQTAGKNMIALLEVLEDIANTLSVRTQVGNAIRNAKPRTPSRFH